jgi:diguanylate cyclase (GGDEF)-like protein/PAS domain S-box-containing protein
VSDQSDSHDANELRRQWESCFEHTRRGISITDPETGVLQSVNPTFARMHGGEPSDFVGKPLTSVFTAESAINIPELSEEVHRTGYIAYESDHVRLDGRVFPVATEVMAARDDDGRLLYRLAWYDDLTDRQRQEARRANDIAEKMKAQDELRRSESRLQEAQSIAHIGSWEWDIAADTIVWSDELCRIFGVPEGVFPDSYEGYLECIHPDDRVLVNDTVQAAYTSLEPYRFEHRLKWKDGTVRVVDSRGQVVADPDGNPSRMLGTAQDITELKRAESGRLEAEERFRRAFEDSGIGMALLSVNPVDGGRFIDANDAICTITGYDRQTLLSIDLETLIHPDDLPDHLMGLEALTRGDVLNLLADNRIVTGAGEEVWVALSTSLVRDPDGVTLHRLVQVQDVSERKRFEGQLRYLADHDSLTGLFNRRRFVQELERELASARRYETGGALLVIDLDNFKYMNDSAGHAAGDELIRSVAKALATKLRETDYLARLGGDEFAVLLPHASEEDGVKVAESLLAVIRDGVSLTSDRGPRRTSASIGVSAFGDLSERASAEQLLIEADVAMYEAKEAGRDRVMVFEPDELRQDAMEQRLTWSNRIRQSLEADRFVLHAQPIVPIAAPADHVQRHELLLRMVGDDGDLIPPATFLFVAERFGLIEEIDRWVVRNAISLVAERNRTGNPFAVSVNLSAKSIGSTELLELIGSELERTGVDASLLVFEVTETAAIERIDGAKQFARGLRALGCKLAIDDFGSGFATFYYLKHLEFDFLKIDGEFVKNLPTSTTDQLVVQSLVDIAKGLGKQTIAEFVGDDATVEMLQRFGVEFGQGFHLGRPGPLDRSEAAQVPGDSLSRA